MPSNPKARAISSRAPSNRDEADELRIPGRVTTGQSRELQAPADVIYTPRTIALQTSESQQPEGPRPRPAAPERNLHTLFQAVREHEFRRRVVLAIRARMQVRGLGVGDLDAETRAIFESMQARTHSQPMEAGAREAVFTADESTNDTSIWDRVFEDGGIGVMCPLLQDAPQKDNAIVLVKQYLDSGGDWKCSSDAAHVHFFSKDMLEQCLSSHQHVHPLTRENMQNPEPINGQQARYKTIPLDLGNRDHVKKYTALRNKINIETYGYANEIDRNETTRATAAALEALNTSSSKPVLEGLDVLLTAMVAQEEVSEALATFISENPTLSEYTDVLNEHLASPDAPIVS